MGVPTARNDDFIGSVLPAIRSDLGEKKSSKLLAEVFFRKMSDLVKQYKDTYKFVRYLNIFNAISEDEPGNVEFYAEFVHQEGNITSRRKEIKLAKPNLFDKDIYTIAKLFRETRKFGESFEYRIKPEVEKILNNSYWVEFLGNGFNYSSGLNQLFSQLSEKQGKFEDWLRILDHCYDNNDDVTHFFLFNGPVYFGEDEKLEQELSKYVVNANVGVCLDAGSSREEVFMFLRQFKKLIEQISFNLIVDIKDYQMRQAAVRSAIAQVMARNMSHNFGSHVLSNLIGDEVYDRLSDGNVAKLEKYGSSPSLNVELFKDKETKNLQLPFFFRYLKSRMDYLSEVTFGVPNLVTTKMMRGDVLKELDQVRILLNYISGISDFKYKFELKYVDAEGKEKEGDFGVAFPSDVLGCHAFYNIIENIIRNTAKHAKNIDRNEAITFTITFKEMGGKGCDDIEDVENLYCVEIDSDVREADIDILVNGKKDEKNNKTVIEGQNTRLNESVLDEFNNLRDHSLGLLEMEASAAFLRQLDMPEIESDDYDVDDDDKYYHERNGKKRLNILKAFAIDVKEDNTGRLGYRFFMQKPREFLLVTEETVILAKEKKEETVDLAKEKTKEKKKKLRNIGIQLMSKSAFNLDLDAGKAFAHQFLLYDSDVEQNLREKIEDDLACQTLLPLRKIPMVKKDWTTISGFWQDDQLEGRQILQKLEEWAWERYYEVVVKKELDENGPITIEISGEVDCSFNSYQVVFKDHGKDFGTVWDEIQRKRNNQPMKEAWVENMVSRTYDKLPDYSELCSLGKGKKPWPKYLDCLQPISERIESSRLQLITRKIFEAYHDKVIILDERVQKYAKENTEGSDKIPCGVLFQSTNVLIPSDFSLDPNDFSENREKVEAFVRKHAENGNAKSKPFILVHYGVLERMYGGEVNSIDSTLNAWVGMAKRVVVTSGRGAHSLNLPETVCFVNLSSVLYACNENRNKYLINYLLNQSRRKRNV